MSAGWWGDKKPVMCDCGRVSYLTSDQIIEADWMVWDGNHLCECGGDVCGCGYCESILRGLMSGCRDGDELNLAVSGPVEWSPERGFA